MFQRCCWCFHPRMKWVSRCCAVSVILCEIKPHFRPFLSFFGLSDSASISPVVGTIATHHSVMSMFCEAHGSKGINQDIVKRECKWCWWIEAVGTGSQLELVLNSHPHLSSFTIYNWCRFIFQTFLKFRIFVSALSILTNSLNLSPTTVWKSNYASLRYVT